MKIPAENDGCPEEQFCRDGNGNECSTQQCAADGDCGDDLVCVEGLCERPTLESFLQPTENTPLKRRVFWDVAAVPEGYSVKVECCFSTDSDDCSGDLEPGVEDNFVDIDFSTPVSEVEKMTLYAQGDYVCGAKLCNINDVCGELVPATIRCGFRTAEGQDLKSFSSKAIDGTSGDPSEDGWFKIGGSSQVGTLAEIANGGGPDTYDDLIPKVDLYATAFTWTESIDFPVGITSPFEKNERVIGIGWVALEDSDFCTNTQNLCAVETPDPECKCTWLTDTSNLYFKIAPSSGNGWQPSTVNTRDVNEFNGVDSFSTSKQVSGQVQLQTQNPGENLRDATAVGFVVTKDDVVFEQFGSGRKAKTIEFLVSVDSLTELDNQDPPMPKPNSFSVLFGLDKSPSGWKFVGNAKDIQICGDPGGTCLGGDNTGIQTSQIAFSLPPMC